MSTAMANAPAFATDQGTLRVRAASIRVFVVDDHPIARGGLAAMLDQADGIEWVGEAESAADALRAAPPVAPDVVLMDEDLPDMHGTQAVQLLRQHLPSTRFMMMVREPGASLERRASEAGVADILPKTVTSEDLSGAIRSVHQGRRPVDKAGTAAPVKTGKTPGSDLTARERDLLNLLARGLSNQEISASLEIAVPTVKFHVSNVMSKLGVENRTAAVLMALRHRLVEPS